MSDSETNSKTEIQITLTHNENTGMWVIKDHSNGIATQGESKEEALLMLVDAIPTDEDVVELSESIFMIQ